MRRRSWTDAHLPGRHAGVGPQHRSSVELDSNDGCLQNEGTSLQLRLIPKVPETATTFEGVFNPEMSPLTPVVTSSDNSSGPGSSSIVTHGCAPEPTSQTVGGGETRAKPKPLQPTSA